MHASHIVKSAASCVLCGAELLCGLTGFARVDLSSFDALGCCPFSTWKHHCDLTGFVRVGWVNLSRCGLKSMRGGMLEACDRHTVVTDLRYSCLSAGKRMRFSRASVSECLSLDAPRYPEHLKFDGSNICFDRRLLRSRLELLIG